jgi:4-hydroxy-tetrahydrodipicolinate synthase
MFKGSIPALVTPFSNGKVDEHSLKELVEWHINEGSNGLVAVGTTGESPTLTNEEHKRVIEIIVAQTKHRIPILAGAGSNSTAESVALTKFAKEVGADGALVVTPYYNKPNQKGLYDHYKQLNDCTDLPIVIYNIPSRSVIDMSIATMSELSKLKNIIGVKDATGDVGRVSDTRAACGENFIQLCGNDEIALGFNAHGGVGCISVTANLVPGLSTEFQNAMACGNYKKALSLQDQLLPLHRAAFKEPNPCPIKYGLSLLGKCKNELRSPLVKIEKDTEEILGKALRFAGVIA